MNKMISIVSTAAVLALSALAGIAPVSAAPWYPNYQQQDRYIGDFCDRNPNASQCYDWRSNHSHWSNSQYQNFYWIHRNNDVFAGNVMAGLFGFVFGATMNGQLGNTSTHIRACEQKYHSYNVRTDTFLGYDGQYHLCRL